MEKRGNGNLSGLSFAFECASARLLGVQVTASNVQFWTIALPVMIAFVAIMGIGGWIGWTMATTPPPKPIEDITSEMEKGSQTKTTEKQPGPTS